MFAKYLLTDLSSDTSIGDGSISRNRRPRLWVPTEPGPRSTPHVLVTRSQVGEAELPLTTSVCCCLGVTSARLRLAGELHQRVCNLWSAGDCPGKMLVRSMHVYRHRGPDIRLGRAVSQGESISFRPLHYSLLTDVVEESARPLSREEGLVRLNRRNQWGVVYSVAVVSSSTLISGFISNF